MKISINIPCYNRKEMLRECIQSFINQSFTDWELILVDDGSEEDLTFVSEMDDRVKYVRQEHLGISKAFNNAIDHSSGEYILPFGSDDIASDTSLLQKLIRIMDNNNDYDVAYTDYYKNGKHTKFPCAHQCHTDKQCYDMMLHKQFIPHGATLWKKSSVIRYDETLESAVDWELFLSAFENGLKFLRIPEPLWTYRVGHSDREEKQERQAICCDRLLRKRGYYFDRSKRCGKKIYNIKDNNKIDGWMAKKDLEWLYNTSKDMNSVVEIGSWKGRSTYALLCGCKGAVYAVDHFMGAQERKDKTTEEAKDNNIAKEFLKNVGNFNNLTTLSTSSEEAVKFFEDKSIDMVFLDGDHSQESVTKDIEMWLPKVKKMICGHDINFPTVRRAVISTVDDYEMVQDIWYYKVK